MSKVYINVFFSSNSQRMEALVTDFTRCQRSISMFSFQAIHNWWKYILLLNIDVKGLYQCFLFKQFTTGCRAVSLPYRCQRSISMFSFQAIHNRVCKLMKTAMDVKGLYQCFLFKQFTTALQLPCHHALMSKVYINVFFSSNSQREDSS